MDTNHNKAAIRRFFEEFMGRGDAAVARATIHEAVVSHSTMPGQPPGVQGVIDTINLFRSAFADFAVDIKTMVAEGDIVMSYVVITGRHQGDFMGIAPTGRSMRYEEMTMFRFALGKVVEHWAVADAYSLMQQLEAS